MSQCVDFGPVSFVPGWRFGESIEVDLAKGAPIDGVSLAAVEGEHPVFGFRRRFLMPSAIRPRPNGEPGRVVQFRYPVAGIYELTRRGVSGPERRTVLIDEWRRVFELPWDVVELVAPLIEALRANAGSRMIAEAADQLLPGT